MNNNNGNNGGNNGGGDNSPTTTTSASSSTSTSSSHSDSSNVSSGLAGKYVAAIVVCTVLASLVVISVSLLCYYRRRRRVADAALTRRAADNPAAVEASLAGSSPGSQTRGRSRSATRALAEQRQPSADMMERGHVQVAPEGEAVGSDEWAARMERVGVPTVGGEADRPGMAQRGSMTTPFDRQLREQGDAGLRGAVEGGGVTQEERAVGEGEVLPSYQQATVGRRGRGWRLTR